MLIFFLGFLICCGDADQEGRRFDTVKIGNQIWMAENLNVEHYRNGDPIPEAKSNEEWISAGEKGIGVWCYYDNDPANGAKYGKLYNWYAVNDPRGLTPEGWHIPSIEELKFFKHTVNEDGNALKAIGQGTDKGVGTNTSGFSALLASYCNSDGTFGTLGGNTYFWRSQEKHITAESNAAMKLFRLGNDVDFFNYSDNLAFSVRCVKD